MKKAFWACVALLLVSIFSGHGISIFAMAGFALYALWKGGLLLAIGYLGYRAYRKRASAAGSTKSKTVSVNHAAVPPQRGPTTKI